MLAQYPKKMAAAKSHDWDDNTTRGHGLKTIIVIFVIQRVKKQDIMLYIIFCRLENKVSYL